MPKRILLTTFGSLGDFHPFLAIGAELAARGHHPVMATSRVHQARVEAESIEFAPMRPEPDFREWVERLLDLRRGPKVLLDELIIPHLRETADDVAAAAAGADLIVAHVLVFPAQLIAMKMGLPWVSTVMAPMSFFSIHDWPLLGGMPLLNRLSRLGPALRGRVLQEAKRTIRPWTQPVNTLRAQMNLAPTNLDPMFEGQFSPHLNLALFSSHFAQPQADWPANTVATGFPYYAGRAIDQAASDQVADFLAGGDPPIVFTLGSSAVWDAGNFYRESAQAAKMLGRRSLLLVGSDPRNREGLPVGDDIGVFDYLPYTTVFPNAAAIVHQGGIGTTAEALRSGRPMVVVPYAFDQPDNAARAARLGCARVLDQPRYSAASAARELTALLSQPAYAKHAADIAGLFQAENGAKTAADAIERLLAAA